MVSAVIGIVEQDHIAGNGIQVITEFATDLHRIVLAHQSHKFLLIKHAEHFLNAFCGAITVKFNRFRIEQTNVVFGKYRR